MVAVVSDSDPFKYAESNQTANSTGMRGISGSVSLSFSSPETGAVTVTNLSIPIRITIPHPPMLDNETIECRYWDPILLEQRTDGCELVESYTNYSVCACDHLTEFSIGALKKLKGLKVLFQNAYTLRQISSPPRSSVPSYPPCVCLLSISASIPASPPQDIGNTKIEELLPSIEPLTAEVNVLFLPQ
jgi:hypothetical protein